MAKFPLNTNLKWQVIVVFLNTSSIVQTENIWGIFRVKPLFSNSSSTIRVAPKIFYIVATLSALATLIKEHLVVLGCCLLIVVSNVHDKFACLQQLNSPNSNNKISFKYVVRTSIWYNF